jgi:signal transduction histidine kinase
MAEFLLANRVRDDRRALLRSPLGRYVGSIALVVAAYYGSARLGETLMFAGPVAAIVWLPVGVGIAALSIGGLRLWPGVLVGDLLANDYTALPWDSAVGQTIGNVAEVLIVAGVLRRLNRNGSPLDSVSAVGWMLVAIASGTLVSATVGSLSLLAGGVVAASALQTVWRTWWLGDASGALVIVPLALAWSARPRLPRWSTSRALECAAMLAAVAVLTELGFRSKQPLIYLVFPMLLWSALRFGQRGATAAIALSVGFAVWDTVHVGGPFHFHSITRSVLSVQLYIAVAAVSTVGLGAVVAEREAFARRLSRSRARMVEAADGERRRLERNLHDGAQHRLTALSYLLRAAAERARLSPDESARLFRHAEEEVTSAIDEMRELAHGIHPTVLTDLGLAAAVRSIAVRSVVKVELLELPSVRVDPVAEATAYYVVAEAVTNAQRYAHASGIRIRVSVRGSALRVEVSDDGNGGARMAEGSGLEGLCDRVEAVGGRFALRALPGIGTHISAVLPAASA